MAAQYEVLCGDDFMALEDIMWPAGLRPIEQRAAEPYCHWWLFEDDNADSSLNGHRVELDIESYMGPEHFGTSQFYRLAVIRDRRIV